MRDECRIACDDEKHQNYVAGIAKTRSVLRRTAYHILREHTPKSWTSRPFYNTNREGGRKSTHLLEFYERWSFCLYYTTVAYDEEDRVGLVAHGNI